MLGLVLPLLQVAAFELVCVHITLHGGMAMSEQL